jgi:hypothetical protein
VRHDDHKHDRTYMMGREDLAKHGGWGVFFTAHSPNVWEREIPFAFLPSAGMHSADLR